MSRDLRICSSRFEALKQIVGGLAGLTVVDIGSGDGAMERQLAQAGATASGVDPLGPEEDWTNMGDGRYCLLRRGAETLPFPDASVDLVLFIFSLHHIPPSVLPSILAEARRVLRDPGVLYVAEPLTEGPAHEIAALFHDETAVRRKAAEILAVQAPALFEQHETIFYRNRTVVRSFEEYARNIAATIRYNDFTEAQLLAPVVRERFEEVAGRIDGVFEQPVRVDLLRP